MENIEAASLLIQLYGSYTVSHGMDSEYATAIALAIGALRKDCERNESN